jgi:DNA repair photolyase
MLLKKRFGKIKDYNDWLNPRLAKNYKEILDKELPKFRNKIKTLHLCFTTDPFMYGKTEIINASIEILNMIADYNINASVLTKGVYPDTLYNLPKDFSFGITLISLDENFRKIMEPGSAPYKDRIASLKELKKQGFNTWVSIEPYPTPNIIEQDYSEILNKISFVDKIIFGKINYNKLSNTYKDKNKFLAKQTVEFCKKNSILYHIKDGTIT